MALLDQMLIEGVRRNAPEIKPWNAGRFMTNVGQFVNTNERINELQRQNSLRNLIAQREQDGVPFDRLSNEAAKYDMAKALSMRGEARDSIKFNRTESEAELANHKKTMAGWLGGLVLRRAQEAVASGDAQWDFDYVVNVCNEAAAAIYPYDPTAATALLNFGKQGLVKKATTNEKKEKDHEKYISDITAKNVPNKDENPSNFAETTAQQHAAQAILRYKNATGNDIWLRQVQWLLSEAKKRFPKYGDGSVDLDEMRKWLDGLSVEQIAQFIGSISDPTKFNMDTGIDDGTLDEENKEEGKNDVPQAEDKPKVANKPQVVSKKAPSLIGVDPGSKKQKINSFAVGRMSDFINENRYDIASLNDARKRLREGMSWAEGNSGGEEASSMKSMLDEVDKLLAHNEEMGGDKTTPAFKKAFDKLLSTGRTATSLNAMMTAFHNVVSSADKSQSALSFLNSILLAQLPFYKPTDYDAKVALTVKGANSFDNLKSVIKDMGIPIFSQIAAYDNIDAAIDAALQDFTRTFNGMYDNWVADANPEEAKEIINGAKSRWNLGPRDIAILKDGKLPIGEVRKKLRDDAAKTYGDTYVDANGNTIDSKTGKVVKSFSGEKAESKGDAKYTKESWDNF